MPAGENTIQEIHMLERFVEPFTFCLNDEEFTVELEPTCCKVWEESHPDLPSIYELCDNPTPADHYELTNLKELTYVGFDKTIFVYMMMQEVVTIRPDLIRAPSTAIGFYNAGIILRSSKSDIPVRRLRIEQTGPEQQEAIRRARSARTLAQSSLQGIASGSTCFSTARIIIQTPAPPPILQAATHSETDMLTIKEAATCAKVDERTIRSWVNSDVGKNNPMLPGVIRSGRKIRIPRQALVPWCKKTKRTHQKPLPPPKKGSSRQPVQKKK